MKKPTDSAKPAVETLEDRIVPSPGITPTVRHAMTEHTAVVASNVGSVVAGQDVGKNETKPVGVFDFGRATELALGEIKQEPAPAPYDAASFNIAAQQRPRQKRVIVTLSPGKRAKLDVDGSSLVVGSGEPDQITTVES